MKKKYSSPFILLVSLVLCSIFSACNLFLSIVDDAIEARNEDKSLEGPRVMEIDPVNHAMDVSVNVSLIIRFDRSLNTAANGIIEFYNPDAHYDGNNATIRYETTILENDTVRITPAVPLPGNLSIDGITIRDFQDLKQRVMLSYDDPAYHITTQPSNNTDPPNIVAISPGDGAGGIGTNAQMIIQFHESMDTGIYGQISFVNPYVTFTAGANCNLTFSQTVFINDTLTLTPFSPLALNMNYSDLTIAGFKDNSGNDMNAYHDAAYNFTTGGTGLVAYYPFDGDSLDASGNGRDAVIFGDFSTAPDRLGNSSAAYYLDGSGDFMETGVSNLSGDFTLMAWVRPETTPGAPCAVIAKLVDPGLPESKSTEFALRLESYNVNAYLGNGSGIGLEIDGYGSPADDLGANEWHHLALVMQGTTARLYLDGNEVGSQTFSGTRQYGSYPIYIGLHEDEGGVQYFKGCIDEVRIYNYALPAGDINSRFNSDCPPGPELIAFLAPADADPAVNINTPLMLQFNQSLYTGSPGSIYFNNPGITYSAAVNCSLIFSTNSYPNDTVTIIPYTPLPLGQTFADLTLMDFYDVRQTGTPNGNFPSYSFKATYLTRDGINDPGSDLGNALVIEPGEKLLIAGQNIYAGYTDALITRYTSSGQIDNSLNGNGVINLNFGGDGLAWDDMFNAVARDSAGRIVAAGNSFGNATDHNLIIARYQSNGTPDTGFGGTGVIFHDYQANGFDNYEYAYDLFIDNTNGYIYVVGEAEAASGSDIILWKYDFYGNPVNSFSSMTSHYLTLSRSSGNYPESGRAVRVNTVTGEIYIAGKAYNTENYTTNACLIKLDNKGMPLSSFDTDGWAFFGNTTQGEGFFAMEIDGNGKILVSGSYPGGVDNDLLVMRYNPDGTKDSTLNGSGYVLATNSSGNDAGYDLKIDSSGRIVIGGTYSSGGDNEAALWRLTSSGSMDSSFGVNGLRTIANPGFDAVHAVALTGDNRIYYTGQFYNGTDDDLLLGCY